MPVAYRNNVVVTQGFSSASFDPPLDAIYVTAAPGGTVTMTIAGSSVPILAADLAAGALFEVGEISAVAAGTNIAFIGLRALNKSGSSNVTNDVIVEGGD